MKVYQTKVFARFVRKAGISAARLVEAADAVAAGEFDADLGGGVFKQRIARDGGGKSGGFRAILLFRVGKNVFLVHGFGKNEKANVSAKERAALMRLADVMLALPDQEIDAAVEAGELILTETDNGE